MSTTSGSSPASITSPIDTGDDYFDKGNTSEQHKLPDEETSKDKGNQNGEELDFEEEDKEFLEVNNTNEVVNLLDNHKVSGSTLSFVDLLKQKSFFWSALLKLDSIGNVNNTVISFFCYNVNKKSGQLRDGRL